VVPHFQGFFTMLALLGGSVLDFGFPSLKEVALSASANLFGVYVGACSALKPVPPTPPARRANLSRQVSDPPPPFSPQNRLLLDYLYGRSSTSPSDGWPYPSRLIEPSGVAQASVLTENGDPLRVSAKGSHCAPSPFELSISILWCSGSRFLHQWACITVFGDAGHIEQPLG